MATEDNPHPQSATDLLLARSRRLARAADIDGVQPSLPSGRQVPTVTLTLDELHDLVYAATTTYLHSLSGMGRDQARMHGSRIGAQAMLVAQADHTIVRADPS